MKRGTENRDRGVTGAIETEREASHKATVRGARRPPRQREASHKATVRAVDPRAQRGREEARKAAV